MLENAYLPMNVSDDGKETDVNALHLLKAMSPIDDKVYGSSIYGSEHALKNAEAPID